MCSDRRSSGTRPSRKARPPGAEPTSRPPGVQVGPGRPGAVAGRTLSCRARSAWRALSLAGAQLGGRSAWRALSLPGAQLAGRSACRAQAHRAVLDPALLDQRHLIHSAVKQLPPVLAEPALRVPLAAERLLGQPPRRRHGAVFLLELPAPGHAPTASLVRGKRQ